MAIDENRLRATIIRQITSVLSELPIEKLVSLSETMSQPKSRIADKNLGKRVRPSGYRNGNLKSRF